MNGSVNCSPRRPVDAPADHSGDTADSLHSKYLGHRRPITDVIPSQDEVVEPHSKRVRTIDDVLGSLSLRPPDPPGNSFCGKNFKHDGNDSSLLSKIPEKSFSVNFQGHDDINLTESDAATETNNYFLASQPQLGRTVQQSPPGICVGSGGPFEPKIVPERLPSDSSGMSIDDSGDESDGSVPESTIRNAMYQMVFGRRQNPLSNDNSGYGHYDSVDYKIEELIRKSRLEAAIKSEKERRESTKNDNVDMSD